MSTRLPGAKYRRVFDRGRSVKGRLLVAWRYSSPDADRMAGVVVSKKTFHDAVDRNRAKRLLREAFRRSQSRLPGDLEAVLVARSGISGKRCSEVMDDLAALFRRAGVWSD